MTLWSIESEASSLFSYEASSFHSALVVSGYPVKFFLSPRVITTKRALIAGWMHVCLTVWK